MPKVTRLIIGERSNKPKGKGSATELLASPSRSRLDALLPGWEDRFVFRNVWDSKEDDRDGAELLYDIFDKVQPDVVVTLGITVSLLLEVPYETPWFDWTYANGVPTMKFPHPSGRSRVWNDEGMDERAKAALTLASTDMPDQLEKLIVLPVDETPEKKRSLPRPATEKSAAAKDKGAEELLECSLREPRYYKVEGFWQIVCDCKWSAASPGPAAKVPDSLTAQAVFHLERRAASLK